MQSGTLESEAMIRSLGTVRFFFQSARDAGMEIASLFVPAN